MPIPITTKTVLRRAWTDTWRGRTLAHIGIEAAALWVAYLIYTRLWGRVQALEHVHWELALAGAVVLIAVVTFVINVDRAPFRLVRESEAALEKQLAITTDEAQKLQAEKAELEAVRPVVEPVIALGEEHGFMWYIQI